MALILDSLEIHNFRRFRHLRIERLARVNLIAGENNIGKTSLLEALRLYAVRGAPLLLWQILRERDESKSLLSEGIPDPEARLAALKSIFYGRADITLDLIPKPIKIGPLSTDEHTLSMAIGWYKQQVNAGQLIVPPTESQIPSVLYTTIPAIFIQFGTESPIVYRLNHHHSQQFLPTLKPLHHIYISSDGLTPFQRSHFWENIVLTDLEEEVNQALRIITPRIVRLSLTGSHDGSEERIPKTRISGYSTPIPLRSLGEGTNRLFGLALALVNAKDGLLLIDEIDSGLYHFVLPDVWRFIFRLAKQFNVQVIATSHSWDCLEAFAKATKASGSAYRDNEQELGQLISLREHQKEEGTVAAVLFDEEAVDIVTSERIEVR